MSRKPTKQTSSTARPPTGYGDWLASLKRHVAAARHRAVLAANAEMVTLYWQIGQELLQRQQSAQWGDKVLDRLGSDLREAFPEMRGFCVRQDECISKPILDDQSTDCVIRRSAVG